MHMSEMPLQAVQLLAQSTVTLKELFETRKFNCSVQYHSSLQWHLLLLPQLSRRSKIRIFEKVQVIQKLCDLLIEQLPEKRQCLFRFQGLHYFGLRPQKHHLYPTQKLSQELPLDLTLAEICC